MMGPIKAATMTSDLRDKKNRVSCSVFPLISRLLSTITTAFSPGHMPFLKPLKVIHHGVIRVSMRP